MTPDTYRDIRQQVIAAGYQHDIDWAEGVTAPATANEFATETIYVICNSGMKWDIARKIYDRVIAALAMGCSAHEEFGHKGKADAIDRIWTDNISLFQQYLAAQDKVEFLGSLPWIGPITKYHLARNFGLDVVKPDRHIQRLADHYGKTPHDLCADIAKETGERIGTVDVVLWRAANLEIVRTKDLSNENKGQELNR